MRAATKLNLGAGSNKIGGYVNIDVEPSTKPDRVIDFINQPLPYKSKSVDEVLMFHTIEHIEKRYHKTILCEIQRVLKPGGHFYISYPEWLRCAENWIKNYRGMRDFWEKTLYGRQLFDADHHVCIMYTPEFKMILEECGFYDIKDSPEPHEAHNTIIRAVAGERYLNYETLCEQEQVNTKFVKSAKR